jgi:hypothetical protein
MILDVIYGWTVVRSNKVEGFESISEEVVLNGSENSKNLNINEEGDDIFHSVFHDDVGRRRLNALHDAEDWNSITRIVLHDNGRPE